MARKMLSMVACVAVVAAMTPAVFAAPVGSESPWSRGAGNIGQFTSTDDYTLPDDGTYENALGFNPGFEHVWVNQFTVAAGLEVLTAVNIAFGTSSALNGAQVTIVVLDGGLNLVASSVETIAGAQNFAPPMTGDFQKYAVGPVNLGVAGDTFYVGAWLFETPNGANFPMAMDQDSDLGRSYLAWGASGGGCDFNNVSGCANSLQLNSGIGFAANWLIRANAIPAGGVGACCNDGTGDCADNIDFDNCQGANERWTVDTLCADLDPPCEPARGACCDLVNETCTNGVFNSDCDGATQAWFIEEDCLIDCPLDDGNVHIEILTDMFGGETSWELVDQTTGDVVASIAQGDLPNSVPDPGELFTWDVAVSGCGCFDFTIFDAFGDGICCAFGDGAYTVEYNGDAVCSGGSFGASETCSDIGGCFATGSVVCPDPVVGACCNFNGDCADGLTLAECNEYGVNGGDWFQGSACGDISCEAIPTVSEWGLVVMMLLGCTLGTVLYGRRRAAKTA